MKETWLAKLSADFCLDLYDRDECVVQERSETPEGRVGFPIERSGF
jgi:hypothetical protein